MGFAVTEEMERGFEIVTDGSRRKADMHVPKSTPYLSRKSSTNKSTLFTYIICTLYLLILSTRARSSCLETFLNIASQIV